MSDPVPSSAISDATTGGRSVITVSGGSDGDVLTRQSDGTYLPETPAGGGNAFGTVQPAIAGTSGTAVAADSSTDTLTLDTGCGMTISGNATTDTITLNAFGEDLPIARFLGTIYETMSGIIVASTSSAVTANRKYLIPWKCSHRRTITEIGISVVSGAGGSFAARLGIRNRNPTTGEPTTLVSDCGTVSVVSAGHKTITGLSVTLDPGWYYLEMVSDGAPAIRGVGSATAQVSHMGIEASSTSTLTMISGLFRAFTYAALPADETGQTQGNHILQSGNLPLVYVR